MSIDLRCVGRSRFLCSFGQWIVCVTLPAVVGASGRPGSMPPKSSLTSSFSASELDSEVVCPLKTIEGSNCRKRCLGVSARSLSHGPPLLPSNVVSCRYFFTECEVTVALDFRRSVIDPCRNTFEGHTPSTISQSFLLPRRASNS